MRARAMVLGIMSGKHDNFSFFGTLEKCNCSWLKILEAFCLTWQCLCDLCDDHGKCPRAGCAVTLYWVLTPVWSGTGAISPSSPAPACCLSAAGGSPGPLCWYVDISRENIGRHTYSVVLKFFVERTDFTKSLMSTKKQLNIIVNKKQRTWNFNFLYLFQMQNSIL